MKCAQWSSSRSSHFKVVELFCNFLLIESLWCLLWKVEAWMYPFSSVSLSFPLPSFIFLLNLLYCSKCVESLDTGKETFSEQDGQHLPDLPFLHKNCNLMPQEAAGQAPTPRRTPHPLEWWWGPAYCLSEQVPVWMNNLQTGTPHTLVVFDPGIFHGLRGNSKEFTNSNWFIIFSSQY